MTKGKQHYLQNIIEDSWIEVYASTNTAMLTYPYVLGHPTECSPTLADMANTYIMDSKIGDTEVTNKDVLRRSKDVGADVVTPADVIHDPETTTRRVVDLFTKLDDMEYDPEVLVPLQPNPNRGRNHIDHYVDLKDELKAIGIDVTNHRLSVGGIKDMTSLKQLKAIVSVRNFVGHNQFLHGLGFGASEEWVTTLRTYPSLLDSVDMTSVVRDIVQGGMLFTPQAKRVECRLPRGKNSTVLSTLLREWVLYMMSYLFGPYPRDEDVPNEIPSEELRMVLETYERPTNGNGVWTDVTERSQA